MSLVSGLERKGRKKKGPRVQTVKWEELFQLRFADVFPLYQIHSIEAVASPFLTHILPILQSSHPKEKKGVLSSIGKFLYALTYTLFDPSSLKDISASLLEKHKISALFPQSWCLIAEQVWSTPRWAEIFNKVSQSRNCTFTAQETTSLKSTFSLFLTLIQKEEFEAKSRVENICFDLLEYLTWHPIDPCNMFVGACPSPNLYFKLSPLTEKTTFKENTKIDSDIATSSMNILSADPNFSFQRITERWNILMATHPARVTYEMNLFVSAYHQNEILSKGDYVAVLTHQIPSFYQELYYPPHLKSEGIPLRVFFRVAESVFESSNSVKIFLDPAETLLIELPLEALLKFNCPEIPIQDDTDLSNRLHFSNLLGMSFQPFYHFIEKNIETSLHSNGFQGHIHAAHEMEMENLSKLFEIKKNQDRLFYLKEQCFSIFHQNILDTFSRKLPKWIRLFPCGLFVSHLLAVQKEWEIFFSNLPDIVSQELSRYEKSLNNQFEYLQTRLKRVISGERKRELCTIWLQLIQDRTDRFLLNIGFVLDALPPDYTQKAPSNIGIVEENVKLLTALLADENFEEFVQFLGELRTEVYKSMDLLFDEISFTLTRSWMSLDIKVEISDQDQRNMELDLNYLKRMREMDEEIERNRKNKTEKSKLKMTDVVPVSGLVMARVHIHLCECNTALEMWGNRKTEPQETTHGIGKRAASFFEAQNIENLFSSDSTLSQDSCESVPTLFDLETQDESIFFAPLGFCEKESEEIGDEEEFINREEEDEGDGESEDVSQEKQKEKGEHQKPKNHLLDVVLNEPEKNSHEISVNQGKKERERKGEKMENEERENGSLLGDSLFKSPSKRSRSRSQHLLGKHKGSLVVLQNSSASQRDRDRKSLESSPAGPPGLKSETKNTPPGLKSLSATSSLSSSKNSHHPKDSSNTPSSPSCSSPKDHRHNRDTNSRVKSALIDQSNQKEEPKEKSRSKIKLKSPRYQNLMIPSESDSPPKGQSSKFFPSFLRKSDKSQQDLVQQDFFETNLKGKESGDCGYIRCFCRVVTIVPNLESQNFGVAQFVAQTMIWVGSSRGAIFVASVEANSISTLLLPSPHQRRILAIYQPVSDKELTPSPVISIDEMMKIVFWNAESNTPLVESEFQNLGPVTAALIFQSCLQDKCWLARVNEVGWHLQRSTNLRILREETMILFGKAPQESRSFEVGTLSTKREQKTLFTCQTGIVSLLMTSDESSLWLGGIRGTMSVYEFKGSSLQTFNCHDSQKVNEIVEVEKGESIGEMWSGGDDGTIHIWCRDTRKLLDVLKPENSHPITCLAVMKDKIYAGTYCGQVLSWNIMSRTLTKVVGEVSKVSISAICIELDHQGEPLLWCGTRDRCLKVWTRKWLEDREEVT